jgi:gluconolactonase
VRVYDREARPLPHTALPERCASLCFGGANGNRLFMPSGRSLYAFSTNTQGAC